jgi:hypothetical protein
MYMSLKEYIYITYASILFTNFTIRDYVRNMKIRVCSPQNPTWEVR